MTNGRAKMSHLGSSIGAIVLALAVGDLVAPAPLAAQGRIRELGCRGGPGLSFRVDLDPSPRDTTYVVMRVDYRPSTKAVGFDYRALDPGTCTWNPTRSADYPAEPGNVRFDLKRIGQPWPAKDTSIKAGAFFPDPVSLPRYLGDSRHYYKFYVDDSTRFSISFGAMHESAEPVFVMTSGPLMVDPDHQREILCRGGTGLMFGGGGSVGTNLASVTMSYRVSANVPGQSGSGLSAGTCAWVDRTGVPKEPGTVTFTTASNAQLKQIQSGSTVDRSPTAAASYPDVNTIPTYLIDPARYWTFTVTAGAPDKALDPRRVDPAAQSRDDPGDGACDARRDDGEPADDDFSGQLRVSAGRRQRVGESTVADGDGQLGVHSRHGQRDDDEPGGNALRHQQRHGDARPRGRRDPVRGRGEQQSDRDDHSRVGRRRDESHRRRAPRAAAA